MSVRLRSGSLAASAASAAALLLAALPGIALADQSSAHGARARQLAARQYFKSLGGAPSATHTPNDGDLADQFAAYSFERTAPARTVSGQALLSARAQAAALPTFGGAWTEDTTHPFNAESPDYTDPFWSNIGAGFGIVGGRTTALLAARSGTWLAGTADGGVWRSTNQGTDWSPVFDSMPSLSIGALANAPDGSVWVGTGEANTSQDSYAGVGVYRSIDDGQTWQPVTSADGSNPIVGRTIFRVAFAPDGTAYAATNNGLWRYSGGNWSEVLAPAASTDPQPYYDNQVTDVAVVPGSSGTDVIAVVGWRSASDGSSSDVNGFFESTDGGQNFTKVTPRGDIDASDIGRTTFAYAADGSKLYAIVESPKQIAAGANSNLQGVFVSTGSGGAASVAGPWKEIATPASLSTAAVGANSPYGINSVGAQSWYNQFLVVDPSNSDHVYLGLEEDFETSDGGTTWDAASPYWNYGFPCDPAPFTTDTCARATHPDQHAVMISDGKVVIGNDGGVYSRPLTDTGDGDWTDLNAELRSWQYYDARAGNLPTGGVGIWGGLQDNGTSLFDPHQSQMVEPASGDGFDVIVDPANANNMAGEYVSGAMYSSTDGGHSFADFVSPTCAAMATTGIKQRKDCDPAARFVTPLVQNQTNANDWLIGGQYVWESVHGWNTKCGPKGCNWAKDFNTGAGNAVTALSAAGSAIYAAWTAGGGNPGPAFGVGLATNVGGWHQIAMTGLPNRYIAGVTVDPANSKHAVVVFNGFSRRWIPGGGLGHVFETFDAGNTWTDIDGTAGNTFPDAPGDAALISGGRLYIATDIGVFTAADGAGTGTQWSTFGSGLPAASVNDLTVGPAGILYAGTHGRGVWSIGR